MGSDGTEAEPPVAGKLNPVADGWDGYDIMSEYMVAVFTNSARAWHGV